MMIQLTDNSRIIDEYTNNPIIQELVDRDLKNLSKDNFIIFPQTIDDSADLEKETYLFRTSNQGILTGNLIGVLKKGHNEIKINSRFYDSKGECDDLFIRYLLQKVLNVNVVRDKIESNNDLAYYDLLAFLFPLYLNEALQKGVYKEYIPVLYNDANVKGTISLARHIRANLPFMGKIAYDVREFSYDNKLLQLIRHTIEKLQFTYKFDELSTSVYRENIREIVNSTPSYSIAERYKILETNILNPVKHGYYEEYYQLQRLCIQILSEDKVGFGVDDDEVHGIIIDVAWLWEKYLATILTPIYTHADNKTGKNPINFYTDKFNPRYPDFYSADTILDAKYKRLEDGGISREDLYQITSYLHVRKATSAGLVFPSKKDFGYQKVGELAGYGGEIFKVGFKIPQMIRKYSDFTREMKASENALLSDLARETSK